MYDNLSNPSAKPDTYYEQVVQLPKSKYLSVQQQAFACMDLLQGWCSHEKAAILIDVILQTRPTVVVEIGVFGGKSLVPMAVALKTCKQGTIYGIDPWDSRESVEGLLADAHKEWWKAVDHRKILEELTSKIQEFDLHNIVLIKATSKEAQPIDAIDILHIDGNHSEESSYLDVTKWVPMVVPGGWIIFDDVDWKENGKNTTSRAVEWLNAHCIKLARYRDSHEWGIWIKP